MKYSIMIFSEPPVIFLHGYGTFRKMLVGIWFDLEFSLSTVRFSTVSEIQFLNITRSRYTTHNPIVFEVEFSLLIATHPLPQKL